MSHFGVTLILSGFLSSEELADFTRIEGVLKRYPEIGNCPEKVPPNTQHSTTTKCTKIAHRRSLAIFAADSGIARNSAVGIKFVPFNPQRKSPFASDFLRRGNRASWGLKNRAILRGSSKNRRRNRRESHDFGALSTTTKKSKIQKEKKAKKVRLCTLISPIQT